MSRNIRLPARFRDWGEYQETYAVDVLLDVNVMRCRTCRREWGIEHNRGKMLQRMHRCPNACNGKPRDTNRYVGLPQIARDPDLSGLVDAEMAEELRAEWKLQAAHDDRERRRLGKIRRRPAKVWHLARWVPPARWDALLRDLEAGLVDGDDSFLEVLESA